MAYVLINLRRLKYIKNDLNLIAIAAVALVLGSLGWLRYGFSASTVIDSFGTLFLGVSFYFALRIRYANASCDDYNEDGNLLFMAYLVSFFYGFAWYCVSVAAPSACGVFNFLQARVYTRLQFTFTEPSFISMHVFGVLMLYSGLVSSERVARNLTLLGCFFAVFTLLANASGRCTIDVAVFVLLILVKALFFNGGHVIRNFFLVFASFCIILILVNISPRFAQILSSGLDFNSDASLASRWFRIQAACHGFITDPIGALFGYGPGNLVIPLHEGFDYAYANYTNSYMYEVNQLKAAVSVDSLFSGPAKLVSDYGLIVTTIFIGYFVSRLRKSRLDPFVVVMTLWLYVQFDSYAFFAFWLLLYIVQTEEPCFSYFQRILDLLSGKRSLRNSGER